MGVQEEVSGPQGAQGGCWGTRVGKEATKRRGTQKGHGTQESTKGGAGGIRGHIGGRGAHKMYRGTRAQGVMRKEHGDMRARDEHRGNGVQKGGYGGAREGHRRPQEVAQGIT